MEQRIVKTAPYGQHIALRCRNHPELRWSTKNIGCIGMRTIFYNLHHELAADGSYPQECNCPMRDLEPVPCDGPEVAA